MEGEFLFVENKGMECMEVLKEKENVCAVGERERRGGDREKKRIDEEVRMGKVCEQGQFAQSILPTNS